MNTILVVDDNADNRFVIGRLLQLAGYQVISATGGHEAIRLAEQSRPALILMDLSMPHMDGWAATAELKQRPHLADIPVIAVTGHVTQEEIQRARQAGCVDFLTKPIEYDRLMSKVGLYLSPQNAEAA